MKQLIKGVGGRETESAGRDATVVKDSGVQSEASPGEDRRGIRHKERGSPAELAWIGPSRANLVADPAQSR